RSVQLPHGKLRPPLMPDAAPPVSSVVGAYPAVVTRPRFWTSSKVRFDTSAVVPLRSSSCLSPDLVIPGLFLPRSRPCLLNKAAEGGLEPAPASRFRGADPHQSNSCAPPQPFGRLLCSWHTITAYPSLESPRRAVIRYRLHFTRSDCLVMPSRG